MSVPRLSVERATVGERVAAALRQELLAGTLAPGTPMRDHELAERAGVARSTIREALAVLAREGLLTHNVNRGMEVRRLTRDDLADAYVAREVIETAGLARLVRHRDEGLRPLEDAFADMRRGAEDSSPGAVADADITFHMGLAEATGSRLLVATQRRALTELRLLFAVTDRAYDGGAEQVVQHQQLLDVFRDGSAAQAQAALRAHLRTASELVGRVLDGTGS